MISALVCHERVGFIWPELEQALIEAVTSMQATYVSSLSCKNLNPKSLAPFMCTSLLIQNITDDSIKILKDCKGLSAAIEMMVSTVLTDTVTTF